MRSLANEDNSKARLDEELKASEENYLSTRQAWAIARERGFTGEPKALSDRVNKSPDLIRQKYGLIRLEGGKKAKWEDLENTPNSTK